jgi:hypothetical protein
MGRRAFISFPLPDNESARLMEKLAEEAGGDYLTSYLGGRHDGHMTVDFDTAHDDGAVLDQVEAALTTAKRAVSVSGWARDKQPLRWSPMQVSAFELAPIADKQSSTREIR